MLRKTVVTILLLSFSFSCRAVEVFETGNHEVWNTRPIDRTVNLGYFAVRGSGTAQTTELLRSSLRYHLSNLGYRVADLDDYIPVLAEKRLNSNQTLARNDLLLLAGSLKERFLIQGYLYEHTRFAIPEDRIDLTLTISIYDTRTGQTASEYRLFMSGTSQNHAMNLFKISQSFAEQFHSTHRKYRP